MTTELFPIPESLSPKLAWLRANGLMTHYDARLTDCPESPETGAICYPWICSKRENDPFIYDGLIGVGPNEEDAIWDYCRKNDLPHYSLS